MDAKRWRRYLGSQPSHALSQDAPHQWGTLEALGNSPVRDILPRVHKVLDVGCGDGWTMEQLQEIGKACVGLTIASEDASAAARRKLNIVFGDMHVLPFRAKAFDLVWMRHTLEHSIAPYIVLCEANRVLNAGGYLFVAMPREDSNQWLVCDVHFSLLTRPQTQELLRKTSFRCVHDWLPIDEQCYLAQKVGDKAV